MSFTRGVAESVPFPEVRNKKGVESNLRLHGKSHRQVPSVIIPLPSGTF